jgi:hypothetical protein
MVRATDQFEEGAATRSNQSQTGPHPPVSWLGDSETLPENMVVDGKATLKLRRWLLIREAVTGHSRSQPGLQDNALWTASQVSVPENMSLGVLDCEEEED